MKTFEASFIVLILALKLSAAEPTPLSALLEEATRNNPDVLAARGLASGDPGSISGLHSA